MNTLLISTILYGLIATIISIIVIIKRTKPMNEEDNTSIHDAIIAIMLPDGQVEISDGSKFDIDVEQYIKQVIPTVIGVFIKFFYDYEKRDVVMYEKGIGYVLINNTVDEDAVQRPEFYHEYEVFVQCPGKRVLGFIKDDIFIVTDVVDFEIAQEEETSIS